jgi:hypothetical protein
VRNKRWNEPHQLTRIVGLLALIDAEYTLHPFYGSRKMVVHLDKAGYSFRIPADRLGVQGRPPARSIPQLIFTQHFKYLPVNPFSFTITTTLLSLILKPGNIEVIMRQTAHDFQLTPG